MLELPSLPQCVEQGGYAEKMGRPDHQNYRSQRFQGLQSGNDRNGVAASGLVFLVPFQ